MESMKNDSFQNIRNNNRKKILAYLYRHPDVSRQEIANTLGLSQPTVFSYINELIDRGILIEGGEYASKGGRKAKRISINAGIRYSIGIDITKHHVRYLLLDLSGRGDIKDYSIRYNYSNTNEYYNTVIENMMLFLQNMGIDEELILGVGVSVPGVVDVNKGEMITSRILEVNNVDLLYSFRKMPFPVFFENDANCAAYAEISADNKDIVYFALSHSVGGASYISGKLHAGDNLRAGQFGHMLLHPGGKKCYCGKKGCFNAYCSMDALLGQDDDRIEDFFMMVKQGEPKREKRWNKYLDDLAIAITNARMAFDCNIVLGGYIGYYIGDYLDLLSEKTRKLNMFENNVSYIKIGKYMKNSSALGIAILAAWECFNQMDLDEL